MQIDLRLTNSQDFASWSRRYNAADDVVRGIDVQYWKAPTSAFEVVTDLTARDVHNWLRAHAHLLEADFVFVRDFARKEICVSGDHADRPSLERTAKADGFTIVPTYSAVTLAMLGAPAIPRPKALGLGELLSDIGYTSNLAPGFGGGLTGVNREPEYEGILAALMRPIKR